MLYVSTRNQTDPYTAHRALHENFAPDGGLFVPFHLPEFTAEEISTLKACSFGQTVAQILNLFFSARLTGWDVEFYVGRHPLKLKWMNRQLIVAELWHNLAADYTYLEQALYRKLCGSDASAKPTNWGKIAIAIAMLFAIYGEISAQEITELDISVETGDFLIPMAAWYARKMGLPIRTILCSGSEDSTLWELFRRGELNTGTQQPLGLECMIYATLGSEAAACYINTIQKCSMFRLDEEQLSMLSDGMFMAVVSDVRLPSVVASVFRTNDYVIDLHTALPYGGLQDYRARFGESRYTLILAQNSPAHCAGAVSEILGITPEDITKRVTTPKE